MSNKIYFRNAVNLLQKLESKNLANWDIRVPCSNLLWREAKEEENKIKQNLQAEYEKIRAELTTPEALKSLSVRVSYLKNKTEKLLLLTRKRKGKKNIHKFQLYSRVEQKIRDELNALIKLCEQHNVCKAFATRLLWNIATLDLASANIRKFNRNNFK